MLISRSINEPIREGLSQTERWEGPDDGIIACWETGRAMGARDIELATRAAHGELVPLPWKGGGSSEDPKRVKRRIGTFFYLAMWQGLRGEDLNIDPSHDLQLVCAAKATEVTFTGDKTRYGAI